MTFRLIEIEEKLFAPKIQILSSLFWPIGRNFFHQNQQKTILAIFEKKEKSRS